MLKLINSWLRVFAVDINKLKESFKPIPVMLPISKALESVETLAENLLEIRPTVMVSVPRVFEKIYVRVMDTALAGSALPVYLQPEAPRARPYSIQTSSTPLVLRI